MLSAPSHHTPPSSAPAPHFQASSQALLSCVSDSPAPTGRASENQWVLLGCCSGLIPEELSLLLRDNAERGCGWHQKDNGAGEPRDWRWGSVSCRLWGWALLIGHPRKVHGFGEPCTQRLSFSLPGGKCHTFSEAARHLAKGSTIVKTMAIPLMRRACWLLRT